MAAAVIQTSESSVDSYLKRIDGAQVDVDACIRLIEAESKSLAIAYKVSSY